MIFYHNLIIIITYLFLTLLFPYNFLKFNLTIIFFISIHLTIIILFSIISPLILIKYAHINQLPINHPQIN